MRSDPSYEADRYSRDELDAADAEMALEAEQANGAAEDTVAGEDPDPFDNPAAELSFTRGLTAYCVGLASFGVEHVEGRSGPELFGAIPPEEVCALYEAADAAVKMAMLARDKAKNYLLGRIEDGGVNEGGSFTERRWGDYAVIRKVELGKCAKAEGFDRLVADLGIAAQAAKYGAEFEACVTRSVDVNRTKLKSLVKAGGEVAILAAQLFLPAERIIKLFVERRDGE